MNIKEFSLIDLIKIVRKRWWVILLCGAIVAAGFSFFSIKTYKPEYRTTTKFYVRTEKAGVATTANEDINSLNWALKVITSYTKMLHTNDYAQKILEEYTARYPDDLEIAGKECKDIKYMINVNVVSDTNLLDLSFTGDSRNFVYRLSECAQAMTPAYIYSITGSGSAVESAEGQENVEANYALKIVDHAQLPKGPINSNNLKRNAAIGFIIGVAIAYIILLLVDLFDVRIKNVDDIINTYTLPVIGIVPSFDAQANRKKAYRYGN